MFTGLIEEIGKVESLVKTKQSARITVQASQVLDDIHIGDSISTNGVCLTVSKHTPNSFTVDVMAETLRASTLSKLISGDKVNLERAVKAGDRFGGHMVSGHIDGTGRIQNISRESTAVWVTIAPPANLLRYIIKRGSIAIDGISLTVAFVNENSFSVSLVHHTASVTALLDKEIGSEVNIECDLIAKHVEKLISSGMEKHETPAIDINYLRKHGFA